MTSSSAAAAPHATGMLEPHRVGMLAFLLSEAAFFSTLIVTYAYFLGKSSSGPTPAEVLSLPLALGSTACLLASSATIHLADRAHRRGRRGFLLFWGLTIVLGVLFLAATAHEWHGLIYEHGLTLSRNLFGTTFFTLVGFHALHVTAGVVLMLVILALVATGRLAGGNGLGVELVTWYWHFVDGVWVVVFTLVYLIGRHA